MTIESLPYTCAACRCALQLTAVSTDARAWVCPTCSTAVPQIDGFPLFGEAVPYLGPGVRGGPLDAAFDALAEPDGYAEFVATRWQRPAYDSYALFQPFNESTRAFDALAALVEERLRPGDVILDLWGRTGWSGELLAGRFPEQQVISLWEGRQGVLGLSGYRHWLPRARRRPNLEIAFAHPSAPLPIATGSVALVHGLDSLHRYAHVPLIGECLRVCREDGVIAFPHVHLTNSAPDPFFERGGTKYHGRVWRDLFTRVTEGSSRKVFVLSEGDLFLKPGAQHTLRDASDTTHYNGLVLIADASWEGRTLTGPQPLTADPEAFLVDNPLLDIDLAEGRVRLDRQRLSGGVEHLLLRHPIYERRLGDVEALRLDALQVQLIFWGRQCLTLGQIAERIGRPLTELSPALEQLAANELALCLPVSRAMAELQRFYVTQDDPHLPRTFRELYERLPALFGERPVFVMEDDGSELGVAEIRPLVDAIGCLFRARHLVVGDRILCLADQHPEYLLTLWAAWLYGLEVVPVDPGASPAALRDIVRQARPRLAFCDAQSCSLVRTLEVPCVQLDALVGEPASGAECLGDLLGPLLDESPAAWPELGPEQPALILFTSGSTGTPKGVRLAQGSLLDTGHLLGRAYGWGKEDVVLSMGGHHVMSGVRNPAIAAPLAGARLVLASSAHRSQPVAVAELARKHGLTVITSVPAFIAALREQAERLRGRPFRTTRLFMVTGAPLNEDYARDVEERLATKVCTYYGLTETGGACCYVPAAQSRPGAGVIGWALGAVLQAVDDGGRPVPRGEPGELRVLSPNLTRGYLHEATGPSTVLEDGWLHTGDTVVLRDDGAFQLVGRIDERIKDARGEIIYPDEIERAVCALAGVREASAVGFDDAGGQQRIAAFVVLADSSQRFDEWLVGAQQTLLQVLGRSKLPSRIVPIESLPRGVNAKVKRRELRARLSDV